jgi:hypothetical protein
MRLRPKYLFDNIWHKQSTNDLFSISSRIGASDYTGKLYKINGPIREPTRTHIRLGESIRKIFNS